MRIQIVKKKHNEDDIQTLKRGIKYLNNIYFLNFKYILQLILIGLYVFGIVSVSLVTILLPMIIPYMCQYAILNDLYNGYSIGIKFKK